MNDPESTATAERGLTMPGNLPTKESIEKAVAKIKSVQSELEQFKADHENKLVMIGVVLGILVSFFDYFLSDCFCPGGSKKRKSKSKKRRRKSRSRSSSHPQSIKEEQFS